MLSTAMGGTEGTYVEEQLLIMERNGYPEETYYTFSYSPVPTTMGRRAASFAPTPTTHHRVIGERQMALLRELAAGTANARSWRDAGKRSAEALATDPRDVLFALLYLEERHGGQFVLAGAVRHGRRPRGGTGHHWPPADGALVAAGDDRDRCVVTDRGGPARAFWMPNADRGLEGASQQGRRTANSSFGHEWSRRRSDRRPQPLSIVRRQLPRLSRTRRQPDCRRPRQRRSLRGGTPPRRGPRGVRPRQDAVLLQCQPRIPHAADADAGAARRVAGGQ